jgi:voltage-gated potassium channel
MGDLKRKLIVAVTLLACLYVAGVAGYVLIEGWTVFDSVYMTVITLASVGYGEVHPLSGPGKAFTIVLIMVGMGTFIYGLSTITAFFVEGELGGYLRRKKVKRSIEGLEGHYIVCGSGDVGRYIIAELHKTGRAFVVVEKDPERIAKLKERDTLLILGGDPTDEGVLLAAGLARARGLVSALDNDKENLFVVMTARSMNPALRIVTKSVDECCASIFSKAGADAVVSPEFIGGLRMASELVRPEVVTFLDSMLRGKDSALRVEEIRVRAGSSLVGKTLREANDTDRTGLWIISVKHGKGGDYTHVPPSTYMVAADDVLIVIGTAEKVNAFRAL